MKTIAKEMPLDLFAKEMNALKKPFNVWAFYDAIPGVDFDCSIIATEMQLWALPDSDLKRANVTFYGDPRDYKVSINEGCETVKWNDEETMQCYMMQTEHAVVFVYTPDGKPLEIEDKE